MVRALVWELLAETKLKVGFREVFFKLYFKYVKNSISYYLTHILRRDIKVSNQTILDITLKGLILEVLLDI